MIKLDVRDSKADWDPYIPKKAPEGAPNILFVLYDDTIDRYHEDPTDTKHRCRVQ